MNALTTTTTAPARKAAGATRRTISAKVATMIERLSLAAAIPSILLFLTQVLLTGTASPWLAAPCCAICLPAFLPSVEPEAKKGGER
ncbi:MAG: hypothetical protein K2G30_09905 [Muribaculaceae bacterium]|nr:hypothetical protein [Muribaculaceae bacterium]